MKKCNVCSRTKSLDEFYKDKKMVSGVRNNCKACHIEQETNRYHDNREHTPDFYSESKRKKPSVPRPKSQKRARKPYRYADGRKGNDTSHPHYIRIDSCRKLGITIYDYEKMYEEQGGRCKICNIHESELKKKLGIDHCHNTGTVRGLLCFNCNVGIGHLRDDPEILLKAIEYITSAGAPKPPHS